MGHYVLLLLLLQLFVVVATVIRIERLWNFKLVNMVARAHKATFLRPDLIRNKVEIEKKLLKVEKSGEGKGNFLID